MTRRVVHRSAIWAAACLGAACASSSPPPGPPGTVCRSFLPRDETPLTEALDSAAAAEALSQLWEASSGLTVARVPYDSLGALDTVAVYSEAMTEATQDRLATALTGYARPRGEPREMVYLFLGDGAGPGLRRVPALRQCRPELLNEERLQDLLVDEAMRLDDLGLLPNRAVPVLWMFAETDGLVARIEVNRSSGRVPIDDAAVRIMRNAVFTPALVEGIPLGVWVQIPVRFQVVGPREPMLLPPPPFPN